MSDPDAMSTMFNIPIEPAEQDYAFPRTTTPSKVFGRANVMENSGLGF